MVLFLPVVTVFGKALCYCQDLTMHISSRAQYGSIQMNTEEENRVYKARYH